jgi:hypothetical protein
MSDKYLQLLVINRCRELGDTKAAEFFAVSEGLVRQWVNGSKTPSLAAVEKVFVLPEGAPTDAAWQGKEVFIAAPFHKSTNPMTLFSLLATWDRPKFGFRHRFGDAFIVHARNQLADDFLQSGLPWCWWWDDDMVVPCGSASWYLANSGIPMSEKFAGLHAGNRLRSHGKSLVGALYFGRYTHGRAMYAEAMVDDRENDRAHKAPFDELKPTAWVGTGCLMHSRQVLLDIKEGFPHLKPQHPTETFHYFSNASDAIVGKFHELQSKAEAAGTSVREGKADEAAAILADLVGQMRSTEEEYLRSSRLNAGEDQTFCRRAAKVGHPAFVDMAVVCGHVGSTVFGPHKTGKS